MKTQYQLIHTRFNIVPDGSQQVHIAFGTNEPNSSRHPCFRVGSLEALQQLQKRVWEHHVRGGSAAPLAVDKPGEKNSGLFSLFPLCLFSTCLICSSYL